LAEKKAKEEALEKARLAALEKARQDSISKAEAAARAKAEADAKARAAAEARAKFVADSTARAEAAAAKKRQQEEAEARRLRELEEQKQALAKANEKSESKQTTASLPVFEDTNYAEGLTEETINESNRKIFRTIIKKSNTTDVFSKVVYNWGGIYYFKNTTSMSEANYNNELKKYKDQLGK
ncbi:MAG: hypothetical protein UZ10_BCD003001665, partial [Bacteroidetes bacterium OLB10]